MRYWFDTEFIERPYTIDLISIGLVAEDDRQFYAESSEVDWSQAHPWVLDNVRPHLLGRTGALPNDQGDLVTACHFGTKQSIGLALREFVGDDPAPEFWAYYADYDWVAFCWLQGTMIELPSGWPMFCRDVKQLAVDLGNPKLPARGSIEHHALNDALWTRGAWWYLDALSTSSVGSGDSE